MNNVELLAPAGSIESFKAAIQNGADAVYLGGPSFGARAYAINFSLDDIVEMTKYAHIRDVKVFVTVNTIVFENELEAAKKYIDFLYTNDVDGIIVQDLGLISYTRSFYPDFSIVASTQMNIHNLEGAKFIESLGIKRVVLARETTIEQVKRICDETKLEVEVFCQGALCVSYSGECLMSSFIGKRSGNRGRCAQPCRLNYQMIKDSEVLNEPAPLLSTKDLFTLNNLDKIIEAGVTSIKIEGRMKSPEYVALTTALYRKVINRYYIDKSLSYSASDYQNLKTVYNRGFTKGYINNESDYDLVNTFRSNHQGVHIGKVIECKQGRIKISLDAPIYQNDGIRIIDSKEDIGLILNKIYLKGLLVNHGNPQDVIEIESDSYVAKGSEVVKTLDDKLMTSLQRTYDKEFAKVPLKCIISGQIGEAITITMIDNHGYEVSLESEYIIEPALNAPTSKERIAEQVNKLGNTPYEISKMSIDIAANAMIPMSTISTMKNSLIEILNKKRSLIYNRQAKLENVLEKSPEIHTAMFKVSVSNLEQLEAIKEFEVDEIYYTDGLTYKKAKELYPDKNIVCSLPRIINFYPKLNDSKYVINENGGLYFKDVEKTSGLYMNVSNSLSVNFLHNNGVKTVTLSPECSMTNIESIVQSYQNTYKCLPNLEVVVYGYYDLMISKYCPVHKVEKIPTKHCNKCHEHQYYLKDRLGYSFPLVGNNDCTMRILNSVRVNLIEYVTPIRNIGIGNICLIFTIESPIDVKLITREYLNAFNQRPYQLTLTNQTYGHIKSGVE